MLILGGSSGPGPLHELSGPHRGAHGAASSRLRSPGQPADFSGSSAPLLPRAAFHVQQLVAQDLEQDAPPAGRPLMLAAYHAHLAERIRYFGPLTPVDLHV